ncbi:hypothetical protein [Pseudomonas sp. S3_A09]
MKTDDDIGIDEALTLKADQVERYLDLMKCNRPCEACGHEHFKVEKTEDDVAFIAHPLFKDEELGLVYVPVTCARCGNTRFLNAITMARIIMGDHNGAKNGK